MKVHLVPFTSVFGENYIYVLEDGGKVALVDPGSYEIAKGFLDQRGLKPDQIWVTHHDIDHVEGVSALKQDYGATVYGPGKTAAELGFVDVALAQGDSFNFAGHKIEVLDTPGHTLDHIIFVASSGKALFCGDLLFVLGCGRVREGTMVQMWQSLQKLLDLDDDLRVYCGHEYTQGNIQFVLSLIKDDPALDDFCTQLMAKKKAGQPTVPTLLGQEKRFNPFLRAHDPAFAKRVNLEEGASSDEIFTALRQAKDAF